MGQAENPHDQQTERILRELNELKQCLTLMLEDKQAQDMDRRHRDQVPRRVARMRWPEAQARHWGGKGGFTGPDSSIRQTN